MVFVYFNLNFLGFGVLVFEIILVKVKNVHNLKIDNRFNDDEYYPQYYEKPRYVQEQLSKSPSSNAQASVVKRTSASRPPVPPRSSYLASLNSPTSTQTRRSGSKILRP